MSRHWHQIECHTKVYNYSPVGSAYIFSAVLSLQATHSNPLIKARVHDCNLSKVTNPLAWHKHLQV